MNRHKNRIKSSQAPERSQTTAGQVMRRTDELVLEHPASSALTTFALGCGLGLLTAWLLAPARRSRRWYEFDTPQWASRDRLAKAAEAVPHSIGSYFSRR